MAKNYTLDFSDMISKLKLVSKKITGELAERGMGRATLQLLNDSIIEIPTVPIKYGWLRGSGSIFVQNKLAGVSTAGKPGMAATMSDEPIKPGDVVGLCCFNAPYCARLHESVGFHFTEPSSGPKFLESKLHRNKERYFLILANTIKEGGSRSGENTQT
jgi:hypothetical protein